MVQVVITEWLTTGDQVRMLDALFQKKASIRNTIEVRGDRTLRESLVASYAHDEVTSLFARSFFYRHVNDYYFFVVCFSYIG